MPRRQAQPPGALSLTPTADDLDDSRVSAKRVELVGRIPFDCDAAEAGIRLGGGVRAALHTVEGREYVRVIGQPVVRTGQGALPYAVSLSVMMPPDVLNAVHGWRDSKGCIDLPAPWGGKVALFEEGAEPPQEVLFYQLPCCYHLSLFRKLLENAGIAVTNLEPLVDGATGLPRADAARALVTPGKLAPDQVITMQHPDGTLIASIRVRPLSRLPPPPGEQPASAAGSPARPGRSTPAALAAAPPQAARRAGSPGGPAAARNNRGPAAPGARRSHSPAAAGARRNHSPAAPGARRSRSPAGPANGSAAARTGGRAPAAARQPSPDPHTPAEQQPCESGAAAKRPCIQRPPPCGVTTANPFDRLTDSDDMDAEPAALLAQQEAAAAAAATTEPADTPMTDGSGGGGS